MAWVTPRPKTDWSRFANYRLAAGRMAETQGSSWVESDWQQRLAGHEAICRRRYAELPSEVRTYCEAYQDGVRAFLTEHPSKRLLHMEAIEPWMVPAVLACSIFHWPMGQAMRELGLRDQWRLFSNQWAVRPEPHGRRRGDSADGSPRPLGWSLPLLRFRMHAGGHDLCGFGPVGTPVLGIGHNACLGWACTTGGPDTTDIYVEQIDPADRKRYRYDSGCLADRSEPISIAVKDAPPVVRTLECSHHGPILLREHDKAFALACPYLDQIDVVTEFYRDMTAR